MVSNNAVFKFKTCTTTARPCPFLTASDNPSGRWKYYNEDKHRWDTLKFPNTSYATLPTSCPELRYRSCALVGNSGSLLEHEVRGRGGMGTGET